MVYINITETVVRGRGILTVALGKGQWTVNTSKEEKVEIVGRGDDWKLQGRRDRDRLKWWWCVGLAIRQKI